MTDNKKIFLFDMDGTLTPPREKVERDIIASLKKLSKFARIGIVTGSDFDYVMEQLSECFGIGGVPTDRVDILPCNGTKKYVADAGGVFKLESEANMIDEIGQNNYNSILRFCSRWQTSIMTIHVGTPYTGTFLQYRGSLLNWCPVGREAKGKEREAWIKLDHDFNIRKHYADLLSSKMESMDIPATVALGGSTSLDIYPTGWDKTYALKHYEGMQVYFVGDKCKPGGNDWHIYDKLSSEERSFEVESTSQTVDIIKYFVASLD